MATNSYEFQHQSTKQKAILWSLKIVVLYVMLRAVYSLGWDSSTTEAETLRDVGSLFIGIWLYMTLLRVKVEVQELFVPPVNFLHGIEFMVIGSIALHASYFF